MSGYVFPSEEELKAGGGGDFKLLPEDSYIARVESIEILKGQTSQFHTEPHEEWKVRFDLLSFSNKDPLYYEDESEPDPSREVRLSCYFDPSRAGMIPRPSKSRKFVTASLGIPISERIELGDPQELVGKTLLIVTIHKRDKDGNLRDRIDDFRPLPKRGRGTTTDTAAGPEKKTDAEVEADAESLLAAAQKVFDVDDTKKASGGLDDEELKF